MNLSNFLPESIKSMMPKGFTPKIALTALLKQLEQDCGHEIKKYRLIYEREKDVMYFEVTNPDNSLKNLLFEKGKDLLIAIDPYLPKGVDCKKSDYVILTYNIAIENPYLLQIFYRDDENKQLKFEHII